MTFQDSVRTCLREKYFFRFQGRASRSEFWFFMLFIALVNVLTALPFSLLPPRASLTTSLIVSLMLLPANLGVTVRRFHDRNMTGWWLLIPIVSLVLAMIANIYKVPGAASPVAASFSLAMCLCYLAVLCMPGQPYANRFGEPPALQG